MPRILLIAFHFPPLRASSGIQRTLKLAKYLPEFGWEPAILTINPRAYWITSNDQIDDIPDGLLIKRSFALDSKRHLSINNRYFKFTAIPDRWVTWLPFAIMGGWNLIRHFRPDLIWSTYPISTSQLIGTSLHRITGIPLIADIRDPIADTYGPVGGIEGAVARYIERSVVSAAERVVLTTPGTMELYVQRYPSIPREHWQIIPNGYDEENFLRAEARPSRRDDSTKIMLVHSGLLSIVERDPRPFFQAVSRLKREGAIHQRNLSIILRATDNDSVYAPDLRKLDIDDIVQLAAPLGYEDALREMMDSDGLLLFQGGNCNRQIPAKAYEYLRARRPIFAVVDRRGDTAALLREAGMGRIAHIADSDDIYRGFKGFIRSIQYGNAPCLSESVIDRYSRRNMTSRFSKLFDEVITGSS